LKETFSLDKYHPENPFKIFASEMVGSADHWEKSSSSASIHNHKFNMSLKKRKETWFIDSLKIDKLHTDVPKINEKIELEPIEEIFD